MELKGLFNISDEQIAALERKSSDIQKECNQSDDNDTFRMCYHFCISGIAPELFNDNLIF